MKKTPLKSFDGKIEDFELRITMNTAVLARDINSVFQWILSPNQRPISPVRGH